MGFSLYWVYQPPPRLNLPFPCAPSKSLHALLNALWGLKPAEWYRSSCQHSLLSRCYSVLYRMFVTPYARAAVTVSEYTE